MMRRNREITIFNLSALDLFASSMGAFMLLSFILFPYYMKNSDALERAKKAEEALKTCQTETAQARNEAAQARSEAQASRAQEQKCQDKLKASSFLAVVIQWTTSKHDVDLYIREPGGEEYYFSHRTLPGKPGILSRDTTNGPGVEVWEIQMPSPGEYLIFYELFSQNGNPEAAVVNGGIYYREGRHDLPQVSLTREKEKRPMARIQVSGNGDISIRNE